MSRVRACAVVAASVADRPGMKSRVMAVTMAVLLTAVPSAFADSRTILTFNNDLISAATAAISEGRYREGIRLMRLGLDRYDPPPLERAAALSNLCAAHAAVGEPEAAIGFCTEALRINEANWRTWTNRAFAHFLSGRFAQAATDLDAAMRLNPTASEIVTLRRLLAERQWRI